MRPIETSTPVLVLRCDHYGALGIMRSLGRLGVAVHGMHKCAEVPALRSRYCRGGFVWDIDEAPPRQSVEYLLSIARSIGDRPVLMPTNDETALFVAAHADELRPAYRFQDNSVELVRALYDKRAMHGLARSLGLPTPETAFPTCRNDVLAFSATARFPVMLKGSDGIRLSRRAGTKMVRVDDTAELLEQYDRLEDADSPDLMLQEYIPGGEDAQWMWNGYFDAVSECLFGITGRKLRQTPVYTGMTSLGVCRRNADVDALTRDFMRRVGYRGILDIGYRFDARDGRYKVLDVNPRIGATFRLFVDESGMDVARALYLDLTGQPVEPSAVREGRKWMVEDLDLGSSLRYRRDGVLSVGQWLSSLRGVRECAWFAVDDRAPVGVVCAARARGAVRKAKARAKRLVHAAEAEATDIAAAPVAGPRLPLPLVARHFDQSALYWKEVYDEDESLTPVIYQERHLAVMRWVAGLALDSGARVLEVGCGAGHTSLALARLGYRVHAVDASTEMVALTRRAAAEAGLAEVRARIGDALALDLGSCRFDLVVAVGVLPWLESDARGIEEMARVLKPGGYLITTADSRARLDRLLDPRGTPLLAPVRSLVKRGLALVRRPHTPRLDTRRHHPWTVDRLIRAAGLHKVSSTSVGFGPFSLLGVNLFREPTAVRVHRALQRLADGGWPLLRGAGGHYLVLARKPGVADDDGRRAAS